jgi:prevent-host-death family protein
LRRVSLADAKAHLSELVDRAAAGEAVCVIRRGKTLAQIAAVDTSRKRIDPTASRAMTDAMPYSRRPPPTSSAGCAMTTGFDALSGYLAARCGIDQRGGNRTDTRLARLARRGRLGHTLLGSDRIFFGAVD